MDNAETFIDAYNDIDHWLRKNRNAHRGVGFRNLVYNSNNYIIKFYEEYLDKFAELRNVIVHENEIIAEPTDESVKLISSIRNKLINPTEVLPLFKKDVITLNIEDSVFEATTIMREKEITQIPVIENGRYKDLLSNNTVARWLGSFRDNRDFGERKTGIDYVLKYKERKAVCKFVAADTKLTDVIIIFDEINHKNEKLEAILITKSGNREGELLGIITGWDLSLIYDEIELVL